MKRFNYSADELKFINDFDMLDSDYWESKVESMSTIKGKIRGHFLPLQKNQCCYCKMLKQENHGKTWDIEHIFPRDLYPNFTFIPLNLAISCTECNGFKSNKEVRIKTSSKSSRYPSTGSNISIIHPHFDNYDDHIKVIMGPDGRIFHTPINKSKKGRATIMMCNLFRFQEQAFGHENFYKTSISSQITKTLLACITQDMNAQEMALAIKVAVEGAINY